MLNILVNAEGRIAELEADNTALRSEVERLREALRKVNVFAGPYLDDSSSTLDCIARISRTALSKEGTHAAE